jgi:tripartite-type tricarboxylate transporter receptor subunit TctC
MRKWLRDCAALAVVATVLCPFPASAAQTNWPNRPIEIVIGFPPGTASELNARFFSDKWSEFLGQPLVIVNKPGASGAIAAKFVANAKPDGYTLMMGHDTILMTNRLGKDVGYNLDNFRIIFEYSAANYFYTVKADAKWKSLKELLADAKQNPGKIKYAPFGVGSAVHFATEMLAQEAGVKLAMVPFKSSADALTAVIGGHVDMSITAGLAGMTGSPQIRPIAVIADVRDPNYPDVPTLKELGFKEVYISGNQSIVGPSGLPDEIVNKFVDAHRKASAKYAKEIKERLAAWNTTFVGTIDGKTAMEAIRLRERKYLELAPKLGIKLH